MKARASAVFLALGVALAAALGVQTAAVGQRRAPSSAPRARAPQTTSLGQPRSAIMYPEERIALKMNHSLPAHRALPCTRCHAQAAQSRVASDLLVPHEDSCLPCHAEQIARANPSAERCGICHDGYGPSNSMQAAASSFPTARLRFSHATHVSQGVACVSCHVGVQDTTIATRANMPTMRDCLQCHGGASPTAPTACRTCHLTEPDGVIRTHYPEGNMNPPTWLHGMHHDADWIVRHRWVGADQGSECANCHRESECAACHDARIRPRSVHPNDFLTIHPQAARRDEPRCVTCHTIQTFCAECHARLGVSTISAPTVRATARFHPPEAVWSRGPVQHAMEARRSMSSCVSCHAERDCVACHGARGIGGGLSPHPPNFAAQCASLLRDNPRACRTCHGDLGELAARCQ